MLQANNSPLLPSHFPSHSVSSKLGVTCKKLTQPQVILLHMDDLKLFAKTEKELDTPLNSGIIFKNITYMEFVINKNIVYQFLEIVKLLF